MGCESVPLGVLLGRVCDGVEDAAGQGVLREPWSRLGRSGPSRSLPSSYLVIVSQPQRWFGSSRIISHSHSLSRSL